jgi:hypothetical protein
MRPPRRCRRLRKPSSCWPRNHWQPRIAPSSSTAGGRAQAPAVAAHAAAVASRRRGQFSGAQWTTASTRSAVVEQGDRHREVRQAAREVAGAVDRVDDPDPRRARGRRGRFFAEEAGLGQQRSPAPAQLRRSAAHVDRRDEVAEALALHVARAQAALGPLDRRGDAGDGGLHLARHGVDRSLDHLDRGIELLLLRPHHGRIVAARSQERDRFLSSCSAAKTRGTAAANGYKFAPHARAVSHAQSRFLRGLEPRRDPVWLQRQSAAGREWVCSRGVLPGPNQQRGRCWRTTGRNEGRRSRRTRIASGRAGRNDGSGLDR